MKLTTNREEQHDDQMLYELLRCIKALSTSEVSLTFFSQPVSFFLTRGRLEKPPFANYILARSLHFLFFFSLKRNQVISPAGSSSSNSGSSFSSFSLPFLKPLTKDQPQSGSTRRPTLHREMSRYLLGVCLYPICLIRQRINMNSLRKLIDLGYSRHGWVSSAISVEITSGMSNL